MIDFRGFWETRIGIETKKETIRSLKTDDDLPDVPFNGVKVTDFDRDDKYFEKLFDLRGVELVEEHFESSDFSYINFSYAKFVDCTFNDVNFFCARFHEAEIINCKFSGCSFEGMYANKLSFKSCHLEKSSFNSCFLVDMTVNESNFLNSNFSSSRIKSPDFIRSSIESCDFSWARVVPTKSCVALFNKNNKSLNLNNVQWFNVEGQPISDPLNQAGIIGVLKSLKSLK